MYTHAFSEEEEQVNAFINNANLYHEQYYFLRAEKDYVLAKEIVDSLVRVEPAKYLPQKIHLQDRLANVYAAENKFHQSENLFAETIALTAALAPADTVAQQKSLAQLLMGQASLYITLGELDKAEAGLQKIVGILDEGATGEDEDANAIRRARVWRMQGELHYKREDPDGSLPFYKMALTLYENLSVEKPIHLSKAAEILTDLGRLFYNEKDLAAAKIHFGRARAIYEPLVIADPLRHEAALSEILNFQDIIARQEGLTSTGNEVISRLSHMKTLLSRSTSQQGLACTEILINLAACHDRQGNFPNARDAYLAALEIFEDLDALNPGSYLPARASVMHALARLYRNYGILRESVNKYMRVIEIREKLALEYPSLYELPLARSLNSQGKLHVVMEEVRQAIDLFGKAVPIYERLAAGNPKLYEPQLVQLYLNLANYMMQKRVPEAAATIEKGVAVAEKLVVEDPLKHEKSLIDCLQRLGYLQASEGKFREAEANFQRALLVKDTYRTLRPERYEHEAARLYRHTGRAYLLEGLIVHAEEALNKSLDMYMTLERIKPGSYQSNLEDVNMLLEKCYVTAVMDEPSISVLESRLILYTKLVELQVKDASPRRAGVLTALASAYEDVDQGEEAITVRLQANAIYRSLNDEGALAESLLWLAILYEHYSSDPSLAGETYRQCLDAYDRMGGDERQSYTPRLVNALTYYSKFLAGQGELTAARVQTDRARALSESAVIGNT